MKYSYVITLLLAVMIKLSTAVTVNAEITPEIKQVLDNSVDKASYDDYLQKLGQPTNIIQGDAIFIVEWVYKTKYVEPQKTTKDILGVSDSRELVGLSADDVNRIVAARARAWDVAVERARREAELHGSSIQLTFDKKTRLMKKWKYNEW